MHQALLLIFIIISMIALSSSQFRITYYQEKPGSCPPPLPIQICAQACFVDTHCQGIGKCCPTSCGGAVCSKPVTTKQPHVEKPGSCPKRPTGRWVCSPTCTIDGDCRGTKKCCKNRCGALACQLPQIEEPKTISPKAGFMPKEEEVKPKEEMKPNEDMEPREEMPKEEVKPKEDIKPREEMPKEEINPKEDMEPREEMPKEDTNHKEEMKPKDDMKPVEIPSEPRNESISNNVNNEIPSTNYRFNPNNPFLFGHN